VWQTLFVRLKKTLLIGMMKTHAYEVARVMPREAANCTAVLTESLLRSSSKTSSQLVKKFTAYNGTRTFVSLLTKAF
jgi:hypothetical protein